MPRFVFQTGDETLIRELEHEIDAFAVAHSMAVLSKALVSIFREDPGGALTGIGSAIPPAVEDPPQPPREQEA